MAKSKNLVISLLVVAFVCFFGMALSFAPQSASAETSWKDYAQSFSMDKGAKVRFDGENSGIRFTATIDSQDYQDLIALNSDTVQVTFGVVVMPYDYVTVGKELTIENLFGGSVYCFKDKETCECNLTHVSSYESKVLYEDAEKYAGKNVISCSLIKILQDNIARPFIGLGYIRYEDSANVETPVDYALASYFGGDIKNNVRSMLWVAQDVYEYDAITPAQEQVLEEMYFAPFVDKDFMYTVNYNIVDVNGEVIKTEKAIKYAPFNTKISAPDYDGEDADFDGLTKVADENTYLIYNENKTLINVNYENKVAPTISGEDVEVAFVGETLALNYTATDALGREVTVNKVIVDSSSAQTPVNGNEYTFTATGNYTIKLTATDIYGNVTEKSMAITAISEEQYGGKLKVSAYNSVSEIVGRASNGWLTETPNHSFNDAGGYTAAWMVTTTEFTEELAGKTPTAKYSLNEKHQDKYMVVRVGVQPVVSKIDLIGYKKYSGFDKLYLEFYNEHLQYPSNVGKVFEKLVGVDENGNGIYEKFRAKSSTWHTLEYDLDMLIENYETIFYNEKPYTQLQGSEYYGLVLFATWGGKTVDSTFDSNNILHSDIVMNNKDNSVYVGGIYFSSDENLANEKYVGVDKISAISSVDNIVARAWSGNASSKYYNFADDGGLTAAGLTLYPNTNAPDAIEEVDGKQPVAKITWKALTNYPYGSVRVGIQPTIAKEDLIKYQQLSGLTKLYVEFYNKNTSWPSAVKWMKKLVGVNSDGTGVYEIVRVVSGTWTTIEFDIQMLIDNYDTIFYPSAHHSTKPKGGLVLLASLQTTESDTSDPNNQIIVSADMVSENNSYYIGEIYFAK